MTYADHRCRTAIVAVTANATPTPAPTMIATSLRGMVDRAPPGSGLEATTVSDDREKGYASAQAIHA
jgi:hypothetical protein